MTATAIEARPSPASVRVPAVASTGIRDVLTGPARTAVVLGTSNHAIWLGTDDDVVVASTRDATRLPNGVEIGHDASAGIFDGIRHGELATVGLGNIAFADLSLGIVRWWDPTPAVHAVVPTELESRIDGLSSTVPAVESSGLRTALSTRSAAVLADAAKRLLGRGPGLTPEGDDYLCGALSAMRILGSAMGNESASEMLDTSRRPLMALAHERTTTFSAELIGHALEGRVAKPAGALLRALAGRGDPIATYTDVTRVGHSSGPALAAGIVLAAQELIHSHTRQTEARHDLSR